MLESSEIDGIECKPSSNFNEGRHGKAIDLIVIHITDGQEKTDRSVAHLRKTRADFLAEAAKLESEGKTEEAAKKRNRNPVSAHFFIGRDGETIQLVSIQDRAWHASSENDHSIGIEHAARTPKELGPNDPGLPVTVAQYTASASLVKALAKKLNIQISSETIKPHCKLPGTTHHDCGRDISENGIWDWSYYMGLLLTSSEHLQEISDSMNRPSF